MGDTDGYDGSHLPPSGMMLNVAIAEKYPQAEVIGIGKYYELKTPAAANAAPDLSPIQPQW